MSYQTRERVVGQILLIRGDSATVRFRDGTTFSMPAKLFVGIQKHFVLVKTYTGGRLVNVGVEPLAPATTSPSPKEVKVMQRDASGNVTTRRTVSSRVALAPKREV